MTSVGRSHWTWKFSTRVRPGITVTLRESGVHPGSIAAKNILRVNELRALIRDFEWEYARSA
jgi:hypothetical protein